MPNFGSLRANLYEIFHSTCEAGDKAALKTLCNQISRRMLAMDAIALHTDMRTLLQPMCFLLMEWKYEDDEGTRTLPDCPASHPLLIRARRASTDL